MPLHELQRLLRADAFDAFVEVRADEQREIDKSFTIDVPRVQ